MKHSAKPFAISAHGVANAKLKADIPVLPQYCPEVLHWLIFIAHRKTS